MQNKKSYHAQLDPKVVSDTKKFWKTVKLLFSNKIQSTSCIALLENDTVESDEGKVAEIMNNYFVNIAETLGSPVQISKVLQMILMRIHARRSYSIFNHTLLSSK